MGKTSLVSLCERGAMADIQKLVEGGVDIDGQEGEFKYTALHMAAKAGRADVVEYLLEKGAKPGPVLSYGYTPLHCAAKGDHYEAALALLDAKVDINATDDMHDTALHVACRSGSMDVALLLIEFGADMELTERYGRKALQCFPLPSQRKYAEDYLKEEPQQQNAGRELQQSPEREHIDIPSELTPQDEDFINLDEL